MSEHTLVLVRLVFRADASLSIGVGHVMRLCAIADIAISRGFKAIFAGDIVRIPWLAEYVNSLGFESVYSATEFNSISSADSILVIDSYVIDIDDPGIARTRWSKIIRIFDETTPEYEADISIHPGLLVFDNQRNSKIVFSGSKFIPFRKTISRVNMSPDFTSKVLIFAGGTDAFQFAFQISHCLRSVAAFDVATFISDDHRILDLDRRFQIHNFGNNIDSLIDSYDLILTSASTSGLEVSARGIPVGIASLVENQDVYYKSMTRQGVAFPIGIREKDGTWKLSQDSINTLFSSKELRESLRTKALQLFDFNGSKRILELIVGEETNS